MLSPTRGTLRLVRASSLGVAAIGLALVAHLAAGGAAPGPVALLLLAVSIGLTALLLTGVRLSPVRVVVSLAAMQVILHEAFTWLGAPAVCLTSGVSASAGGHMGMVHGGQPVLTCATGMAHAGMSHSSVFAAMAMLGAHVAATAVMAALLAYGERVIWFLAGWVRPRRWLPMGLPELQAFRVFSFGAPPMLQARFACGGVGLRGPPRVSPRDIR